MKTFALAVALALLSFPALANCAKDVEESITRINEEAQRLGDDAEPPKALECEVTANMLAEGRKLVATYQRCQGQLGLTDDQLVAAQQDLAASEADYEDSCK